MKSERYLLLWLLSLPLTLSAALRQVPTDYSTIQIAIDAAVNGDTVLVEPGTYYENITLRGKAILLTSHFVLSGDPADIEATILDGSQAVETDSSSVVRCNQGETRDTIIQGLTLTGGTGTRWPDEHGAGTYYEGGGIFVARCSPTIRYNRIIGNHAARTPNSASSAGGGGIRCGDGQPLIVDNLIADNDGYYGGGIVLNYTAATVCNNLILANCAWRSTDAPSYGGGGIWINGELESGANQIVNNDVLYNQATGSGSQSGKGGGMLLWSTNSTVLENNLVWFNTQTTGLQIKLFSCVPVIEYCDLQDSMDGTGNLSVDPQLDSCMHLATNSPLVDAGNPETEYNDPTNDSQQAIFPSLGNSRNDIGVFGGPERPLAFTTIPVATDDPNVFSPATLLQMQLFPNPTASFLNIRFSLAYPEEVEVSVYNLRGQRVCTLSKKHFDAGEHTLNWNGTDTQNHLVPSGVYLCRIRSGDFSKVSKIVYLQ